MITSREPPSRAAQVWDRLKIMDDDETLTPGEVARLFRVDPKTVTRWAARSRIVSFRTPGGHRRFRVGVIRELLAAQEGHR